MVRCAFRACRMAREAAVIAATATKLPLGNASMTMIYDPAHPITRADPYPAYARLRAEDPVHWTPAQGLDPDPL